MAELSFPWDGTSTGDANIAPYNAATEFASILELVSGSGALADEGGVFLGYLNDLLPSSGGVSPVAIASGAGIVYGTIYTNSTSVNVAIPTPAGASRIDRIVLRKSWAGQTIRVARVAGTEGAGAPAITQTPGVTWDILLAQVTITTGGVVTVVDEREPVSAPLSSSTLPTLVAFDVAAAIGNSEFGARANHVHELTDPPVATTQNFNDAAATGDDATLARSDHVHGMPKFHRKYKTVEASATGILDADLQAPVLTGEIYSFWGSIMYDQGAALATDISLAISAPVGSTYEFTAIGPDTTTPATLKAGTTVAGALIFGADASFRAIQYSGTITIAAPGGTLGLILSASLSQPDIHKYSSFMAVKI